jgi:hypothetical protein
MVQWLGKPFSRCEAKASAVDDLLWLPTRSTSPPLVVLRMVNTRQVWSSLCGQGVVRSSVTWPS